MKSKINATAEKVKESKHVSSVRYYASLLESVLFLIAAIYATHFASSFAEVHASNFVDDIILSNTRVYNFELVFVQGAIMLAMFVFFLCYRFKSAAPFILKSMSLLIIIRALFVTMTHIGPYPLKLEVQSGLLNFITSGNDLFFSGHTGLPFLIALIFWNHVYIRSFFLASSIVFGAIVLLAHLHYTIDVFAAFFITYAIYHIAQKMFSRDYESSQLEEMNVAVKL